MKSIFFITGLPRCRSAWLATLFTWDNCFCLHDGLSDIENLDELDAKFDSAPGGIAGNSDPANVLFHEALIQRHPDARWLIVTRSQRESELALEKVMGKKISPELSLGRSHCLSLLSNGAPEAREHGAFVRLR